METFGRTVVEIHSLGARHDADARGRARVDERRHGVAARGGRARVQLPALERVRQGTPRLAVDASKRSGRLNTRIDTCGGFSRANQSANQSANVTPHRDVVSACRVVAAISPRDVPTLPRTSPTTRFRSPLLHHTSPPQATEQFKRDAVVLLAPFGNRIPAGVKGLDAVLGEYVAFKEADTRRKRAVASNPLAKRMYDVLEECAAGVVPAGVVPAMPGAAGPLSAKSGDDGRVKRAEPERDHLAEQTHLPSPSAAAMPPPPARSPHRGKKRGGAAPRRNAPAGAPAAAPRTSPNVFGSLDDDAAARTSWRNYELPRALNDARVQERLAAVIADRIPSLDEARTSEDALFAGFAVRKNGSSASSPGDARRRTSPRTKQKTQKTEQTALPEDLASDPNTDPNTEFGGLDVDEVMESLFENDADGTLGEILGPLLGMPPRNEGAASGKPSPKKRNADPRIDSRGEADEPTNRRAKRRLRLGSEAEKEIPAHVRALDVDAFVKSIEY